MSTIENGVHIGVRGHVGGHILQLPGCCVETKEAGMVHEVKQANIVAMVRSVVEWESSGGVRFEVAFGT